MPIIAPTIQPTWRLLAGARVTERFDETRRGKAFALGHGIQTLQADPPAAVAIVDADAKVKGDSLSRVAALAVARNRPMQTLNVIDRSRENRSLSVVTILGNRLHNVVRPLALQRLGFPCLLMGSGMVFPWQMASSVGLENESLGEDKQLGVDMMLAGYAPEFYLETKVASHIAEQGDGYAGQRTRWEQGHLLVALGAIPRLLWQALTRRNLGYLAIALELAVPPIALTALFWMIAAVAGLGQRDRGRLVGSSGTDGSRGCLAGRHAGDHVARFCSAEGAGQESLGRARLPAAETADLRLACIERTATRLVADGPLESRRSRSHEHNI